MKTYVGLLFLAIVIVFLAPKTVIAQENRGNLKQQLHEITQKNHGPVKGVLDGKYTYELPVEKPVVKPGSRYQKNRVSQGRDYLAGTVAGDQQDKRIMRRKKLLVDITQNVSVGPTLSGRGVGARLVLRKK